MEHVVAVESRINAEEHPDRLNSQHELASVRILNRLLIGGIDFQTKPFAGFARSLG